MNAEDRTAPRHSVRLTSLRTGLTPHTLRAWERRYHVVAPVRSEGGQRLYSDLDVERLRLLRRLTAQGHTIGHLARLPFEELDRIAQEEAADSAAPRQAESADARTVEFRSAAVRAAQGLAAGELQTVLERAAVTLGVPAFLDHVAGPAIREIGHGWETGAVTVGQEHLATAVFRQVLGWIIDTVEIQQPAHRMVVATPPGQAHELGALLAAACAASEGWEVIYLGADLPIAEVVNAAEQSGARGVALSVVHPSDDRGLIRDIQELRQGLNPEVHLFLGGAAVAQRPERFSAPGVTVIDSLGEFRTTLRGVDDIR